MKVNASSRRASMPEGVSKSLLARKKRKKPPSWTQARPDSAINALDASIVNANAWSPSPASLDLPSETSTDAISSPFIISKPALPTHANFERSPTPANLLASHVQMSERAATFPINTDFNPAKLQRSRTPVDLTATELIKAFPISGGVSLKALEQPRKTEAAEPRSRPQQEKTAEEISSWAAQPGQRASTSAETPVPSSGSQSSSRSHADQSADKQSPANEQSRSELANDSSAQLTAAGENLAEAEEPVAGRDTESTAPAPEPTRDAGLQVVISQVREAAAEQRSHPSAAAKASEASAAAQGPPDEVTAMAEARQVAVMDEQEPQKFDRQGFAQTLLARVEEITPSTLEEADEFKEQNRVGALKDELSAQVSQSKDAAQGNVAAATAAPPDTSGIEAKQVDELPAVPKVAAPRFDSQAAAPPPASEERVSLTVASRSLDAQMSAADLTREQLESSNEPQFQSALAAKDSTQQHSLQAPQEYRASEQEAIKAAQSENQSAVGQQFGEMAASRGHALEGVFGKQGGAKKQDEQKRSQITAALQELYDKTKSDVENRLAKLDTDVHDRFESAATAAQAEFQNHVDTRMQAYKDERYSGIGGAALWLKDYLTSMPGEVNAFYQEGKARYIASMKIALNEIATLVEIGLTEAKQLIVDGRKQVDDYVKSQPQELQKIAREAAGTIQSQFQQLEQTVDDKQNAIVDGLVARYQEKVTALDAQIDQMKQENRGLLGIAKDQILGVANTVLELKNMLSGVLAKAGQAVSAIIAHPVRFVGNLVTGVGTGLRNFMTNIGAHLKEGFFAWLFGAMAAAGIDVPLQWDLKGIFGLVMQVMGATYQYIRSRAVKMVGVKAVTAIETTAEIFKRLTTEGPAALWEDLKEQVGGFIQGLIDEIKSFLETSVIKAGIEWILNLLTPASAFVKACKMIYQIVQFFVTRAQQVAALVNAVMDSVLAIAQGSLTQAARYIETSLIKSLPVAIGFLASLVGLGGLSNRITAMIRRLQKPVNQAIDWVIARVIKLGGMLRHGKGESNLEKSDLDHEAKLANGIAFLSEQLQSVENRKISVPKAKAIASQAVKLHSVFRSVDVLEDSDELFFEYVASPKGKLYAGHIDSDTSKITEAIRSWDRPGFGKKLKTELASGDGPYASKHESQFEHRLRAGFDRRHIIPFQEIKDDLLSKIEGQSREQIASILANQGAGFPPKRLTDADIIRAAKAYLRWANDNYANLWVGDSSANRSLGAQRDPEPDEF